MINEEKIKEMRKYVNTRLKQTMPDIGSFILRTKHIDEMIRLAKEDQKLSDTLLVAMIFHDITKFSDKDYHALSGASEWSRYHTENPEITSDLDDHDKFEIYKLILWHSSKENKDIEEYSELALIQDYDILSKYTINYNKTLISVTGLINADHEEKYNFYATRMDKLKKKRKIIKTDEGKYLYAQAMSEFKYKLLENNPDSKTSRIINDNILSKMADQLCINPEMFIKLFKANNLI